MNGMQSLMDAITLVTNKRLVNLETNFNFMFVGRPHTGKSALIRSLCSSLLLKPDGSPSHFSVLSPCFEGIFRHEHATKNITGRTFVPPYDHYVLWEGQPDVLKNTKDVVDEFDMVFVMLEYAHGFIRIDEALVDHLLQHDLEGDTHRVAFVLSKADEIVERKMSAGKSKEQAVTEIREEISRAFSSYAKYEGLAVFVVSGTYFLQIGYDEGLLSTRLFSAAATRLGISLDS